MGVVEVLDPVAPVRAGGWKVDVSRGERNGRVSSEWFNRPDDERYLSLDDLWASVKGRSERSRSRVVQTADIRVEAARDNPERLHLMLPKAHEPVAPTHWAFGQLASIVGAPASYLRQLPAPLAGINLQYGLTNHRAEQVKTFETEDGRTELRAVTGPDYGRIHDHELVEAVQRIFFKDGERVKSVEGCQLISTQLVLEISSEEPESVSHLTADIELEPIEDRDCQRLQLVILESLVLRRDSDNDPLGGNIQTRVLVQDGDEIPPGAVVARTEIQCKEAGEIRGIRKGSEAVRRLLIVRTSDEFILPLAVAPTVKAGDLVIAETEIGAGVLAPNSGQVLAVDKTATGYEIRLRKARPYRVSAGAILHIDEGDLVQRGDNLVLLVFERSKTGDLARYLPDGNIEYLGRIDNQVKLRGFRIELGEIQTVLETHPNVEQTVVIMREYPLSDKRLVAYVIRKDTLLTSQDLRRFLQQKLPVYMIPSAFVMLSDFPLNPNGKIDVHKLPIPDETSLVESPYLAPRNSTETILVSLWQQLLQAGKIGVNDNFFELGGHSLQAMNLMALIYEKMAIEIPLSMIYEKPTVAELSDYIIYAQEMNIQPKERPYVVFNKEQEKAVFLFPPALGFAWTCIIF